MLTQALWNESHSVIKQCIAPRCLLKAKALLRLSSKCDPHALFPLIDHGTKMKIGIQTWGSNGDIRPMIALADGLTKAGHSVSLVVTSLDNRSYAQECAAFNISYQQIPELIDFDLQAFAQQLSKMNTQ